MARTVAPATPAGDGDPLAVGLLVGRHLGRDLHLDQHAFMIAEPEAVALEAGRRIDQLDAGAFDARLQPRQVVGVAAERQMMQRLGLALHHRAPAVFMTEGLDRQRIAVAHHVEAEIAVEILRDIGVGHRQHELVERMHAERIGFPWSARHSREWRSLVSSLDRRCGWLTGM